jgi:hypothetical protein
MRKLLYLLPLLFLACASPTMAPTATATPDDPAPTIFVGTPFYIYDSAWTVIGSGIKPIGRDLTADGWATYIAEYNAAHLDDQYIFKDGEYIPPEEAPLATAIITHSDNTVIETFTDVSRVDLATNRESWRLECAIWGDGVLYVDRTPPPVVLAPIVTDPYILYAIYLLDQNGTIQAEAHTTPELYTVTLASYNLSAQMNPGWTVVTGRLYP